MITLDFLWFLSEPWFVVPWYVFGLASAIWVTHDEYRNGLPLPDAALDLNEYPGRMERAAAGALSSLKIARESLEQRQVGKSGYALDSAYRIIEVGKHAASGICKLHFIEAFEAVDQARRDLHNSWWQSAMEKMEEAITKLESRCQGIDPCRTQSLAGEEVEPSAYRGAVFINAQGVRIGELVRFTKGAGGERSAEIRLGVRDVFGFLDLGGKELTVPVDRLIFGKLKTAGSTMVCLPVLGSHKVVSSLGDINK